MKNFSLNVLLRLGLLTIFMTVTVYAFLDERIIINRFILVVIDLLILSELFRFLHYTNRQLKLFIESLKQEDFTVKYASKGLGKSFDQLNEAYQSVMTEFMNRRTTTRGNDQFLEMAFDRLDVGVITIAGQEIIQMNVRAMKLLSCEKLHSLDTLQRFAPEFSQQLQGMSEHDQATLEMKNTDQPVHLSIHVAGMAVDNTYYRLVTFQDIREALDQKEIESWIRLIRILTHEIMNSVTPISSLSDTMNEMLTRNGTVKNPEQLTPTQVEDLSFSLQTISRRSQGLLTFVEDYRKFTRVTKPKKTAVNFQQVIQNVKHLLQTQEKDIIWEIDPANEMTLWADEVLLEQVLINVITNAIDALSEQDHPTLSISIKKLDGMDIISIKDNGSGIPEEELKEVFVPFFTTKKSGSGIGLSLSRQILHLHGGTIKIESVVTKGTTCNIFLPSLKTEGTHGLL
jgi:nitrogen fixation/metabolism regulation signal transduction histidine kinase